MLVIVLEPLHVVRHVHYHVHVAVIPNLVVGCALDEPLSDPVDHVGVVAVLQHVLSLFEFEVASESEETVASCLVLGTDSVALNDMGSTPNYAPSLLSPTSLRMGRSLMKYLMS